jgi:hypothetical protein
VDTPTTPIGFRVPVAERQRVERAAARVGVSMSRWMRAAFLVAEAAGDDAVVARLPDLLPDRASQRPGDGSLLRLDGGR